MPSTREVIKDVDVAYLDGNLIVVTVRTDKILSYVWPYVRGTYQVPDQIRRISSVWSVKSSGTSHSDAKEAVINDVIWREDNGHVAASPYAEGFVFGWCGTKR